MTESRQIYYILDLFVWSECSGFRFFFHIKYDSLRILPCIRESFRGLSFWSISIPKEYTLFPSVAHKLLIGKQCYSWLLCLCLIPINSYIVYFIRFWVFTLIWYTFFFCLFFFKWIWVLNWHWIGHCGRIIWGDI